MKAFDLLKKSFPGVAGDTAEIVFKAEQGVTDPDVTSAMKGLFSEISEVDRVIGIDSPYTQQGARQISPEGTMAFATVHFSVIDGQPVPLETGVEIKHLAAGIEVPGLRIEPGGSVIESAEFEEPSGAKGIGVLYLRSSSC